MGVLANDMASGAAVMHLAPRQTSNSTGALAVWRQLQRNGIQVQRCLQWYILMQGALPHDAHVHTQLLMRVAGHFDKG